MKSRGLCLLLLLLGNEVQAVSAALDSGSGPSTSDRSHEGGTPGRSLAELTPVAEWAWPEGTTLTIKSDNKKTAGAASVIKTESSDTEVTLLAGLVYEGIAIKAPSTTFSSHTAPKIKLVTNLADRLKCHLSSYDVPVGKVTRRYGSTRRREVYKDGSSVMGDKDGPLALTKSGDTLSATTGQAGQSTPGQIVFMYGGLYKLCYTADGTFTGSADQNNVLSVNLKVIGVTSPCTGIQSPDRDGCIEQERYECSFSYKGENHAACDFNLKPDGGRNGWGITAGAKSRMTWTEAFPSTATSGSLAICGDTVPDVAALDVVETGYFLQIDGKVDPTAMPPVAKSWRNSAFTVGACYCPNYDHNTGTYCSDTATSTCCDDYQEYIQSFGIIYYWTLRICDKQNYMRTTAQGSLRACNPPYMRVVPQQKFVLRLDCPPSGGCKASDKNRIKFVDHTEDNLRPTWDLSHGCKAGLAGTKDWKATESVKTMWPPRTTSNQYKLDGGADTGYKVWHETQVKFNLGLRSAAKMGMDVCYCNENCEWSADQPATLVNQKNWFRVGTVFTTDAFGFATKPSGGAADMNMIKYVNEGGSVTLFGGITSDDSATSTGSSPYDSNMYSGKGLMNIISYDRDELYNDDVTGAFQTLEKKGQYDQHMPANFQTLMDKECQREVYTENLVDAGAGSRWNKAGAKKYMARVAEDDDVAVSQYFSFNGPWKNESLKVLRAGVVGICYCGLLTEQDLCTNRASWLYAGRVTIHGPVGGHAWVFPTKIVVNLEMQGWGFSDADKLRIIPASGICSGTPLQTVGETSFKIGCPDSQPATFSDQGCVFAKTTTSISLSVLNAVKSSIFIKAVSSTATQSTLTFTDSIKGVINPGDIITLGIAQIENNGNALAGMSEKEQFDAYALAGTVPFQNQKSESFMVGHRVSAVADPNGVVNYDQLSIPIGWPNSAMPKFTFKNKQGHWTRHNHIEGPRTIKGETAKNGLKACWGVTDGLTKYYAEAGTVSFQDPPQMKVTKINLSTKQSKAVAPVIVSFTTSPTASSYAAAKDAETTLLLRFKDAAQVRTRESTTGKLIPRYAGDTPPDLNEIAVSGAYPATSLKAYVAAGETEIFVKSQVGLQLGMTIDIDTGNSVYEVKRISAIGTGITLDSKLVFNHTEGSQITVKAPLNMFRDTDEVIEKDKRQWVCGKLFKELWSDDSEGFPMPTGCYFTKKLRDKPDTGVDTNFFREYYVTFPAGSGLKQGKSYQIVLNAEIKSIREGDNLVDLYSLCTGATGCARPYQVFELGTAVASSASEMAGSPAFDPTFNQHGFTIQGGNPMDGVLDLKSTIEGGDSHLSVKLRGMAENGAIAKSCILRMFMWPMTLWELPGDCSASCIAHSGTKCQGAMTCTPQEAVPGSGRKNIVKVQLPAEMDSIDGVVQHTVKVSGLSLPQGGFFASRAGAQVTRDDDSRPSYTTSYGLLMQDAVKGQTTGRLVMSDRTGYGPAPFAGNTSNTLYVRIVLGATLRNSGQADAATLTLTLPDGYTCNVPDDGKPDLTLPVFTNDLDKDGYYDSNRGFLSVATADGNWKNSAGKLCIYEPSEHMSLFAGTVVFVKVTVDNPSKPVHKTDLINNVWSIKVSSKGSNTINRTAAEMSVQNFISLEQEKELIASDNVTYWAGNAAVLSSLADQNIQPTNFQMSTKALPVGQYVHVFFKTTQYVGRNGYVILDAPVGFDFGAVCSKRDLPAKYYAFRGTSEKRVFRLTKTEDQCVGYRYPVTSPTHNRAVLRVGGIIGVNIYYGFMVKAVHPMVYSTSQQDGWYLSTSDSNRYGLEGTISTVRFNAKSTSPSTFYEKAYGMYSGDFFDSFFIEVKGLQPRSISGADSEVVVYPLTFAKFLDTSLRITAPDGYEWVTPMSIKDGTFTPAMNMSTIQFPGEPQVVNGNQLVWPIVQFSSDQTYGFIAKIRVPDFGPVTSTDNFFVEFGYNKPKIGDRLMAAVLPAPRIAAMTNAAVSYASNLRGYRTNWLEFRFETVTLLWENEGIVIKGDINTKGFELTCNIKYVGDSPRFPDDKKCIPVKAVDELPQLVIKAQATPIPPGYYRFEISVSNPLNPIPQPGNWRFGSYKRPNDYPNIPTVDREIIAPGFPINGPILDARVMTLNAKQLAATGRNDRPDKANQLIFRFQLRKQPTAEGKLMLRGPFGFVFDEDCTKAVVTAKDDVFGPKTSEEWPGDLTPWPVEAAPTLCIGLGAFATLTIPKGLGARNMYVFRIGITANPPATPFLNKWTVDFHGESSEPFEGFTVWTLTQVSVLPTSLALSPPNRSKWRPNPVEIKFRPFNNLENGGIMRITAPSGFDFVDDGEGNCQVELYDTKLGPRKGAFKEENLLCKVARSPIVSTKKNRRLSAGTPRSKLWLEMKDTPGIPLVVGGREYSIIVQVFNPLVKAQATSWALDSFRNKINGFIELDKITYEEEALLDVVALDEVGVVGKDINNVLAEWTVTNKLNRLNGKNKVNDVSVVMSFPDSMRDHDEIIVEAPYDFDLMGNPELEDCKEFRWETLNPFDNTESPKCSCALGYCKMTFHIIEYKEPAFPDNTPIKFAIATQNPSKTPFVTNNFWKCSHRRFGKVMSSQIYHGWEIKPQLENVMIDLVGTYQRAESISTLSIAFTPVLDAYTLKIEALFPTHFDFGEAALQAPLEKDDRSEREVIIINNANILADVRKIIKLKNVRLGRGGGQTKFNILTFTDKTMTVKLDERLGYMDGFILPGRVTVTSKSLKSKFQAASANYPVKSLFIPRTNELAVAEFMMMFSQPVMAAQRLFITCLGTGAYELRTAPFLLLGKERVEVEVSRSPGKITELAAILKPGMGQSTVALEANMPYTLVFWVVPQHGPNFWRFLTTVGARYPTNTNDGITEGFAPVEQMSLAVVTPRSPPMSVVKVHVNVNVGQAVVYKLLIIIPPAFMFPPSGCGSMCIPGEPLGATSRRTAVIQAPTGERLKSFTGIEIIVMTPEETPSGAQSWFVEALGQGGSPTTGWGEGMGFQVQQMAAGVSYAGLSELRRAQISFHFTLVLDAGSEITVEPPTNYRLRCSAEGALKQGSLPGTKPGCTDEPLVLSLTQTLKRGQYSFAVEVDLPAQKSVPNNFNLIIRDRDHKVVDANYALEGVDLVEAPLTSPDFSWSSATPGLVSFITIGIEFKETYETPVKCVLINFPDKFPLAINKPKDVVNGNPSFPLSMSRSGGWAEWLQETLRIFSTGQRIYRGYYSWTFPVGVPLDSVPNVNVWYLTLCSTEDCAGPKSAEAIVAFPMQGFVLGEISPNSLRLATAGAPPRTLGLITFIVAVAALLVACPL